MSSISISSSCKPKRSVISPVKSIPLLLAAILSTPYTAVAEPGDLDTSFGTSGIVNTASTGFANATATQPDGKILVLYNASTINRYLPNGDIDLSFGSGGVIYLDPNKKFNDFAIKRNGKIVLVGQSVVMQLNSDGSIDNTFGEGDGEVSHGGALYAGIVDSSPFNSIALQEDERIVILTTGFEEEYDDDDWYVTRLRTDGKVDPSFGDNGVVKLPLPSTEKARRGTAIRIDRTSGNIIVAAENVFLDYPYHYTDSSYVVQLTANGKVDSSFGRNGIKSFWGDELYFADILVVLPSKKILIAGDNDNSPFTFKRLNVNGSFDSSFRFINTQSNLQFSLVDDMLLQPNGKILLSGATIHYKEANSDDYWFEPLVLGLNWSGQINNSFGGGDGHINTSGALALQPDGKFIVADTSQLARYLNDNLDLVPDSLRSTMRTGVTRGATVTSNPITIKGISNSTYVPLNIKGGTYSINNGPFTKNPGWVKKGDVVRIRHKASSHRNTVTKTTLTVGGLQSPNNIALILGERVSTTFTSKTKP